MRINAKIKSFVYYSKTYEDAYLKGCRDLCKAMQDERISINVSKEKEENGLKAVRFNIYTNIDVNEPMKNFCKTCKEFHCSFYINEEYNCSRCNLKSFMKRMNQQLNVSKGYYKQIIE